MSMVKIVLIKCMVVGGVRMKIDLTKEEWKFLKMIFKNGYIAEVTDELQDIIVENLYKKLGGEWVDDDRNTDIMD